MADLAEISARSIVIGNGMLARAFNPHFTRRKDVLVFASGVSNSLETCDRNFAREASMLELALAGHAGPLVYFGSCNIVDADRAQTPYAMHKRAMELRVLEHRNGLVLRLPQVVGRTENAHTIANYLRDRILADEPFAIWQNAERNIVDVEDVAAITGALLDHEQELPASLSIASTRSIPMPELVSIFERVLGKKARFTSEPRGAALPIDASVSLAAAAAIGLDLGAGYAERVIRKYYAPQA